MSKITIEHNPSEDRLKELGVEFLGDQFGARGVDVGNADPVDLRITRCDFAARKTDTTGADDGQSDPFWIFLMHRDS